MVTAVSAAGFSIFDRDEIVEPIVRATTGNALWWIWGADPPVEIPAPPSQEPLTQGLFPEPGGYRAYVLEFPAAGESFAEVGQWPQDASPGSPKLHYQGGDGLHWTPSVEIIFVISGSVGLEQDGGEVRILQPGDVVVQNGATHVWRPQASRARVGVVAIGAGQVTWDIRP